MHVAHTQREICVSVSMHVCLHCEWCVNMYICRCTCYRLTWLKQKLATMGLKRRNVCETQLSVVYDAIRVGCLLDTPLVYDYFYISA